jgi:hypothetical protein
LGEAEAAGRDYLRLCGRGGERTIAITFTETKKGTQKSTTTTFREDHLYIWFTNEAMVKRVTDAFAHAIKLTRAQAEEKDEPF